MIFVVLNKTSCSKSTGKKIFGKDSIKTLLVGSKQYLFISMWKVYSHILHQINNILLYCFLCLGKDLSLVIPPGIINSEALSMYQILSVHFICVSTFGTRRSNENSTCFYPSIYSSETWICIKIRVFTIRHNRSSHIKWHYRIYYHMPNMKSNDYKTQDLSPTPTIHSDRQTDEYGLIVSNGLKRMCPKHIWCILSFLRGAL